MFGGYCVPSTRQRAKPFEPVEVFRQTVPKIESPWTVGTAFGQLLHKLIHLLLYYTTPCFARDFRKFSSFCRNRHFVPSSIFDKKIC